jgi:hypothetical protein
MLQFPPLSDRPALSNHPARFTGQISAVSFSLVSVAVGLIGATAVLMATLANALLA